VAKKTRNSISDVGLIQFCGWVTYSNSTVFHFRIADRLTKVCQ
jgi:hypothetical protein